MSTMLHCASRPFSSLHGIKSARVKIARNACFFHRLTTDFTTHDARGNIVTKKVRMIIGNPGETYVLIDPGLVLHFVLPVYLHQHLLLLLKIDVNLHSSMTHNTLVLVRCQCPDFSGTVVNNFCYHQKHRVTPAFMSQVNFLVKQSRIQALQLCFLVERCMRY